MDNLLRALQEIRTCPCLYIGTPSIERLYAYIGGFSHSETFHNNYSVCLDGFQEYVQKIYDIKTDHNWASIIRFFSTTEDEAFEKFYKHLDDFLESKIGDGLR